MDAAMCAVQIVTFLERLSLRDNKVLSGQESILLSLFVLLAFMRHWVHLWSEWMR